MKEDEKKVGIIGAGLMGSDIAALFANAGYNVVLVDKDEKALENAEEKNKTETLKEMEEADLKKRDEITPLINYTTQLEKIKNSSFIVEAIVDKLKAKNNLMKSLENTIDKKTVIGTNTSTLTAKEIAKGMNNPERVVLFHFANPAISRKLVEIAGDKATKQAKEKAAEMAKRIEKEPVLLDGERRGNCLSRMSAAIKCSGSWELLTAKPESIDKAAKELGFNRGPIELLDLIGIDLHLDTVTNLSEEYGDRFEPPKEVRKRMEEMIESGKLGKKTGEGFYKWENDQPTIPEPELKSNITPIVAALVNEAHKIVQDGVANQKKVDKILKLGSGGSLGPFDIGEMLGEEELREVLEKKYGETNSKLFKPAKTLGKYF